MTGSYIYNTYNMHCNQCGMGYTGYHNCKLAQLERTVLKIAEKVGVVPEPIKQIVYCSCRYAKLVISTGSPAPERIYTAGCSVHKE